MFCIYHKNHTVRHPSCVYNKLDWSVYTCLTQLYDGRDMYIIYYISLPSYSCDRQTYTLQSSLPRTVIARLTSDPANECFG